MIETDFLAPPTRITVDMDMESTRFSLGYGLAVVSHKAVGLLGAKKILSSNIMKKCLIYS